MVTTRRHFMLSNNGKFQSKPHETIYAISNSLSIRSIGIVSTCDINYESNHTRTWANIKLEWTEIQRQRKTIGNIKNPSLYCVTALV